jgi:LysM repeat protein
MWQDGIHLETMISPNYRHIGAGVASNGNYVFYTIDVGNIGESPGSNENLPPAAGTTPGGPATTPGPAEIALVPIKLATAKPDGSITHVVWWGQFLENIAKAYDVQLNDLLALNGITNDTIIYEGDKLLVKVGVTPEPTRESSQIASGSETIQPTQTPANLASGAPVSGVTTRPAMPTEPVAIAMILTPGPAEETTADLDQATSPPARQGSPDYLFIAVIGLAISGAALVLLGSALKRI